MNMEKEKIKKLEEEIKKLKNEIVSIKLLETVAGLWKRDCQYFALQAIRKKGYAPDELKDNEQVVLENASHRLQNDPEFHKKLKTIKKG